MEKEQNASNMSEKIEINTLEEGIKITFPSDLNSSLIKGKVSLYRPSNKKLDFEVPISLSGSHLLIPENTLVGGRWDISIDWTYDGKEFLNKKTIYF
jgi:nitrogen fixation protein FixH